MTDAERLIHDLPDPDSARRFLQNLSEKHPAESQRLLKKAALLSDVLVLASWSPLMASTLLQHPEYISWLERERQNTMVRETPEMLESLARFSLTNSQISPHVMLARFRRRELMRIFLRDIRKLSTVAEITEEVSNLADAILEHALRLARQELDNRFGPPMKTDARGRKTPAEMSIVSLGKLGSKELNYSSDIDLLFIYSSEGETSGSGSVGALTNREYFCRLAETVIKLVGHQGGEGAAYRVDMRLRPHGRVAPLAISLSDALRYYRSEAAAWERQVLIRSRSSAGSRSVFKSFSTQLEEVVFGRNETVESALAKVRASKQKIDIEHQSKSGFNVKLGRGGIREIEFIAQALQLAHGGRDRWLRCPHTLICLARLADKGHIARSEQTRLFDAYTFLRSVEHTLQMEHGLQTHLVPSEISRRALLARKMGFADVGLFEKALSKHIDNVSRIFARVFGTDLVSHHEDRREGESMTPSLNVSDLDHVRSTSRRAAEILANNPSLAQSMRSDDLSAVNYRNLFEQAAATPANLAASLAAMRKTWTREIFRIIAADVLKAIDIAESKRLQTNLAEASIDAALLIARREIERRYTTTFEHFPLAVLGVGKLGSGGLDYESDLDLVMVYDSRPYESEQVSLATEAELYSKAVEIFTNVLSSITRDGSLYRVDLRLRPYGKKGPVASSRTAIVDYFRSTAATWELLAFVKLRAVGGDLKLAQAVEDELRGIIHERALQIDPHELAAEVRSVRERLEKQKVTRLVNRDVDIKYGEGGLLDVYFAVRYLQLRYDIRDRDEDRSTFATLSRIAEHPVLVDSVSSIDVLREGYFFLSRLDHALRLVVGRTSRLPLSNANVINPIAERFFASTPENLMSSLALHRIAIREAMERLLS